MKVKAIRKNTIIALCAVIALASCANHSAIPPIAREANYAPDRTALSIVRTGRFTEYSLPSTFFPRALALKPDGSVWFPSCDGTANLSHIAPASGIVTTLKVPLPYSTGRCGISYIAGYFWYPVQDPNEAVIDIARVTSAGYFSAFFDTAYSGQAGITNIVDGADGRLWFGVSYFMNVCGQPGIPGAVASMSTGGVRGLSLTLPQAWICVGSSGPMGIGYFEGNSITSDTDGYLYLTAGSERGRLAAVFQISTSGRLQRFDLPDNSFSYWGGTQLAIAEGSDAHLWITEPALNKIARLIPSTRTITQYLVPTANAVLSGITSAADQDLWFTESAANKIGRIVPLTGAITEYAIPTASSHPTGIISCPATICGPRGAVWFAETSAHKIARYDFP